MIITRGMGIGQMLVTRGYATLSVVVKICPVHPRRIFIVALENRAYIVAPEYGSIRDGN